MPSSTSRGGTPRGQRRPSSAATPGGASRRPAGTAGSRRPSEAARGGGHRADTGGRGPRLRPATVRRLAGLAAVVVLLAIMLVPTLRRYLEQRDQIASLDRSIVQQQRQVQELTQQRARWDDKDYVEAQIRGRLHFVKPGETSYTVLDPQTGQRSSVDATVVGVDADSQQLPWYGQVWTSLSTADRLGADPAATSHPSTHIGDPSPSASTPAPGASTPAR